MEVRRLLRRERQQQRNNLQMQSHNQLRSIRNAGRSHVPSDRCHETGKRVKCTMKIVVGYGIWLYRSPCTPGIILKLFQSQPRLR